MPGPRQPIELLEAKGRKNLTKSEKDRRKATEVSAPSDKVKPPTYLSKELKREFNKIAKELLAIGIITNLDIDALARYVIAQDMYKTITLKLLDNPNMDIFLDLLTVQDKLFKQCRSAAMDLGLTISSRCKLVMPTPKDPPKNNPFDKFVKKA